MVYRQTLHVKHLDITSGIWPESELLSVSFKQLMIEWKPWQMTSLTFWLEYLIKSEGGLPVLMYDIMHDWEKSYSSELYTQLIP